MTEKNEFRGVVWSAIAIVLAISGLALLGWLFDIQFLRSVRAGWTNMKIATALSLVGCALALIAADRVDRAPAARIACRILGGGVALVGLLSLAAYVWGDAPLLRNFFAAPGRMALLTAAIFIGFGSALVCLGSNTPRISAIAHAIALPPALMSWLVLLSYLFGVTTVHTWMHLAVAFNTGLAGCALAVGIWFVRPQTWFMSVWVSGEAGGLIARKLLPAVVAVPVLIEWSQSAIERTGLAAAPVAAVMSALANALALLVVLWLTVRSANLTDRRRKQAEEAIRTLALFPEQNPSAVLRVGRDGALLYANQAAAPLLSEWGCAAGQHVPPLVQQAVASALADDAPRELDIRTGGREISFQVTPVADCDYANLYGRDTTERRSAEEALRQSEAMLRQQREWLGVTLTSIGDAVLATDVEGKITFLNPVAERLTGWRAYEALQQPIQTVFRIINEDTRQPAEEIVARVLREGHIIALANHTALITRDGREVPIEDSAAPIRDAAGGVAGVVLVFHDVTEKRRAEEALRKSERSVRLKLDSILSPQGDVSGLDLGDIIDAKTVQSLMDDFYRLAPIPMAVIDLKGEVLVGVGWQDICTKYHRVNAESCKNCIESDTQLAAGAAPGEFKRYKCKNNMWDVATPLIVGGEHVGNLFTGQFFYEDEPVDRELFRSQAKAYGFPEEDYLSALDAVPRLSRAKVNTALAFLMKLGHMISLLSYSNLKLARSLTERDALTASLKRSGDRLSRAQEIAHVGSWELDLAADRLSWSDEVYRIFGLQPQEFGATYEAFLEHVHPDDRAAVDAAYSGSLREGKSSYEIVHRVVRNATGEIRWVHEKCEHIRDEAGAIVRSIGMVQDITERRRAEEELRQASRQRMLAIESAELGTWDYRLSTGEVFWDERCRDMFGVPAGDRIAYAELMQRIQTEDRSGVDQAMKEAIAGANGGAYHREFRVVWPDGSVHWVDSHGRAYFEGAGPDRRAARFIGVNLDITERKRTEEAVRHAQKLESIGLLAGGIAHDFNNLLVGVIGNASLAQEMLPAGNEATVPLDRIVTAGQQAAHLTRQLLAYAGKGKFVVEPVNLSQLVRENEALIHSSIAKKITIELDLASDLPLVESDPSQMQQVFMNLVLNAGEAIGGNAGTISIRTGEVVLDEAASILHEPDGWTIGPGRHVFLEVHDTGSGMDAATKARIFDPFFTTKFQGRGLGLAAVAGIVRAQKGAIEVSSAPGAGSTFRVVFPAVLRAPAATQAPAAPERDLRGEGTVLVVDDEQVVRELARGSLERQGYEVLTAESGPAAIEIVRSERDRIRLVVLDLSMPVMSGQETLPLLRELKPDLDVIVSSGYSETETLRLFQGIPVSGFIQKPYRAQDLAREVKAALRQP